jgi:RNA polymerase sigma-70 factor (ECF subfamily)
MNMDTIPDDQELLRSILDGTDAERAFTLLVKRYQERLYWHIRRMVVDHESANDVLQNAFIKIWKNLGQFRGESSLGTWLYRIATNESINHLNQLKRRMSISLDEHVDLSDRIKADPNFRADRIEWKLQLAMQALPEKQRIVFMLRYYEEMPYQEMSKVLETSEGALKASYHHAVKKIEHAVLNEFIP